MLDALGVLVARPMSAIKTVQYATVTVASGASSGTATITSVTIGKTVIIMLGWTHGGSAAPPTGVNFPRITLTNATTVTANTGGATTDIVIASFVVAEYW